MNPLTLLDAFGERAFLIGLGFGLGVGVIAMAHRRVSVWFLSTGLAAALGLLVAGRIEMLDTPPVILIAGATVVVLWASWGAHALTRDLGPATPVLCLLVTALGIWGTVPDTEHAVVLLGVVGGASVGAVRFDESAVVHALAPVLLFGVASYVAITEGLGRESAPVGALATFGLFLIYPMVASRVGQISWRSALAVQVATVVFVGRVAGTADTAAIAMTLSAAGLIGGGIVLLRLPSLIEPAAT